MTLMGGRRDGRLPLCSVCGDSIARGAPRTVVFRFADALVSIGRIARFHEGCWARVEEALRALRRAESKEAHQ